MEARIHCGHRRKRRFQLFGQRAQFGCARLKRVSATARLHQAEKQDRDAEQGKRTQHERRGFVVDGYFGLRHLQFYFSRERKKLALDEVEQKNAREYLEIGRLVYFANSDIELVRGSGETRRRFLDFVAVQCDAAYRQTLARFLANASVATNSSAFLL